MTRALALRRRTLAKRSTRNRGRFEKMGIGVATAEKEVAGEALPVTCEIHKQKPPLSGTVRNGGFDRLKHLLRDQGSQRSVTCSGERQQPGGIEGGPARATLDPHKG